MKSEIILMYIGGTVFGFGLALSGMAIPEVVLSFLYLEDFGLLLVMASALSVTLVTFQLIPKLLQRPFVQGEFPKRINAPVTKQAIVGAVIFGIGWGISGLCPATSITAIGMGNWPVVIGILGMFVGAFIYGTIRSQKM